MLRKAAMDQAAMKVLIGSMEVDDQIIGFHAQQAEEKYFKALLSHCRIPFPRSHDLRTLLDLLEVNGHKAPLEVEDICLLFPYAVEWRYDDVHCGSATAPDRTWMADHVEAARAWVTATIGLPAP